MSAGSMRETVSSSTFATQTPPTPVVIACGSLPTGTSATSSFEAGSMTPTELGETDERPPESRVRTNAAIAATARSTTAAATSERVRERDGGAAGGIDEPSAERVAAISSPAER